MVKVGIATVMKALGYVGLRRENAVSCIAARYLASGLPAAVFFLALRLLFPEVSESIFW
jgi:hypothetical protein